MKKIFLFILVLMIISLIGCQQAAKKEVMENKDEAKVTDSPEVETSGEAVVDAVGSDLDNVNNDEKDLSVDELSDLDSGLADIGNI